nr:peptidyl-prolyl cis-trans isomerase [uncultured Sellimonas sp.]
MKKRLAVVLLAAAVAAGAMAGCGKQTIEDSDVVATVGDTEIKGNVANFYARYQQAMYETYYGSMMGDNMWKTEVEKGKTYEETAKETIMQSLEELYLVNEHAEDYKVSLTDEEEQSIEDAADQFVKDNDEDVRDAISGDKDTVEEVMKLFTIQQKMQTEMLKDVDRNVSDEEAAQKAMQYVAFTYSDQKDSQSSDSDSTTDTKEEAKKKADTFFDAVKGGADFGQAAEDQDKSAIDLTFDSSTTSPNEELIQAADKLEAGQVTDVIETDTGYYVGKVTSTFDQAATDSKKQEIISQRESEKYNEIVEDWKKDTKIKENKDVWKKIDFNGQGVAIKTEDNSTDDGSDSSDSDNTEDNSGSADSDNTDDSSGSDQTNDKENTENTEEAAQ